MDTTSAEIDFIPLAEQYVEAIEKFLVWRENAEAVYETGVDQDEAASNMGDESADVAGNNDFTDRIALLTSDEFGEAEAVYVCVCSESSTDKSAFFQLECLCFRCTECLNNNVRVGLEAKKYWPPRCQDCDVAIQFDNVQAHLEDPLRKRWLQVAPEFSDPSPTYCAKPNCHVYIPRTAYDEGTKYGTCRACDTKTCTACGSLRRRHKVGDKCPDVIEAASLEEMRKRGYKPCPWCSQMIERIEGCDHMHCEPCGKNFCYNCGRKKGRVELPCNCKGEHDWVEEAMEEMDPDRQQDILDRINGVDLHRDHWDVNDVELLPYGRFAGLGHRVGDADQNEEGGDEGIPDAGPIQMATPHDRAFNHWQAVREDDDHDFFPAHRFHGAGRRLGDTADDENFAMEDYDRDVFEEMHQNESNEGYHERHDSNFHLYGNGQRLDEDTGVPNEMTDQAQYGSLDEIMDDAPNARDENRSFGRHRYRGHGNRLGSFDEPPNPEAGGTEQAAQRPLQQAHNGNQMARNVNGGRGSIKGRYFQGAGHRISETPDEGEQQPVPEGQRNQDPQNEAVRNEGFNHYSALGNIAGRRGRYHPYGRFSGHGYVLGE